MDPNVDWKSKYLPPSSSHSLCRKWDLHEEMKNPRLIYVSQLQKVVLTSSFSWIPCCCSHGLVETPIIYSSSKVFLPRSIPFQLFRNFIIEFRILKMNTTYQTLVFFRIRDDGCWNVLMKVHIIISRYFFWINMECIVFNRIHNANISMRWYNRVFNKLFTFLI